MTYASEYLLALARRNAQTYAALPTCRAILVTGSAAEGLSDHFSDLDMGAFYTELPSEAELQAAREQNGGSERLWMLGDRDSGDMVEAYMIDGVECQIGHSTIEVWERDMALVLEKHEVKTPLHKALSGTLESIPLYGERLVRGWQARAADFPEGLARKMIEEYMAFFPLWYLQERLATRDATLWRYQALLEGAQNILGMLAGLNRLYYTTFQFKRMRSFIAKMTVAPTNLADRLEGLFQAEPPEVAAQLEALVGETLDLVAAHRPEIDTSAGRRRLGKRLQAWTPAEAASLADASLPPQPILITGYTARMLAELAVQAGYQVIGLDYFGDYDLRALAPSVSLLRDFGGKSYRPATLAKAARDVKAPSVVYGASFENHPDLVADLAHGRHLIGNTPEVLTRVRDPLVLAEAVRAGGFEFPQTFQVEPESTPVEAASEKRWLWKPRLSGGGHGVRRWRPGADVGAGIVQERLAGKVGSIVFAADGQAAVVLGLTEQLVGRRAFGASGFHYCGNLVPPRLPEAERAAMLTEARALATHLTATFGLRGVNGVDFVWQDGRIWTVEVNPRPSAPLELIDSVYNVRTFDAHVRACAGQLPDFDLAQAWAEGARAGGKAVLFASENVLLGDTSEWFGQGIRDVPHPGERIEAPHPVCTLLAAEPTPQACLRALKAKADVVRSWFVEGK